MKGRVCEWQAELVVTTVTQPPSCQATQWRRSGSLDVRKTGAVPSDPPPALVRSSFGWEADVRVQIPVNKKYIYYCSAWRQTIVSALPWLPFELLSVGWRSRSVKARGKTLDLLIMQVCFSTLKTSRTKLLNRADSSSKTNTSWSIKIQKRRKQKHSLTSFQDLFWPKLQSSQLQREYQIRKIETVNKPFNSGAINHKPTGFLSLFFSNCER